MKKNIILCLVCLAMAAGLAGCGKKEEGLSSFTVELDGNITTGYEWVCAVSAPGIVKQVISDYKSDADAGQTGAGGTFIFEFEGVQPGTVELVFDYTRPWEEDSEPEKTVSYKLDVDKNLLIHAEELQAEAE